MATPICNPCLGIPCDNPPDLASGIDGAIYSALDYSFIVQCPPLCFCPPSLFPQTISILASTIPPVIPPIPETGLPIILRLQGCSALITRTLPFVSNQATIAAAAQSMQAEWAGQQALCNALLVPGITCTNAPFIDLCNDAQNFICPYNNFFCTVLSCTYTQRLYTAGLTPVQITAQVAQIKANLNLNSKFSCCQYFGIICPITEVLIGGGGDTVNIIIQNVSSIHTFDSSSFQLCHIGGAGCNNSVGPSVPPNSSLQIISVSSAFFVTNGFEIRYLGGVIFTDPSGSAQNRQVTIQVGCGG
jgi:hypothetical protein